MSKASVMDKLEAIKLKRAELELALMERQVKDMLAQDAANRMTLEQQERNMRASEAKIAQLQADCVHHKGGNNLDGFYKGSGEHFSVIRHTYPVPYMPEFPTCTGTVIHCQRCHREWNEGDADFQEALRFTTNNQPSGNPLFTITYTDPRKTAAA